MVTQRKRDPFCGPCLIEAEYWGPAGLPHEAEVRIRALPDMAASFLVTGGDNQRGLASGGPDVWAALADGEALVSPITVMIADDDALLRESLALLLTQEADLQVVGAAAEGAEAVSLAEALQPDVLLLDIRMPGLSGLAALPKIRAKSPQTKVLILSGLSGEESVAQALMHGAKGYLHKRAAPADLVRAVRAVHAEGIWADRRVVAQALEGLLQRGTGDRGAAGLGEHLTGRERDVIRWAAEGLTNKEIAAKLGISEKTVKTHLSNIFAKLKVRRRVQLQPFVGKVVPE